MVVTRKSVNKETIQKFSVVKFASKKVAKVIDQVKFKKLQQLENKLNGS